MNNLKSRRTFVRNSLLGTGSIFFTPNFISCSKDSNEGVVLQESPKVVLKNFDSGVASFDPTDSDVIIWTRYTSNRAQVQIQWQMSLEENFESILRVGDVITDASRDYTISIKVEKLDDNQKIYYRFIELLSQDVSITGETLTFPTLDISELKLGVTSCANYELGYFNVYQKMAISDIDLVVHLGDYIYENGTSNLGKILSRSHNPSTELLGLEDYRTRYKQYRSDESLKLLHQKKPFICVWDDHEISNDAYKDGAGGHQTNEGPFQSRKQIALQVYSEYLPFSNASESKIYRSFKFGNLVQLTLLDTRLIGREKQLDYSTYFDSQNNFDASSFQEDLSDSNRTMLGTTQKDWLLNEINSSSAEWLFIGQQVLMGKMYFPAELVMQLNTLSIEFSTNGEISSETLNIFQLQIIELVVLKNRLNFNDPTLSVAEKLRITSMLPYNLDAWDGYPFERELILNALEAKKTIVLSGDSHNAWHNKITKNGGSIAINEFATAAVTSSGFETLVTDSSQLNSFQIATTFLVDGLQYFDAKEKGFININIRVGAATSEWVSVASIAETPTTTKINHTVHL